jgi:hypothetical protein
MSSFAHTILQFYQRIIPPIDLPAGVKVLFPQQEPGVMQVVEQFCKKYYSDNNTRTLIFGINPGRFGAGTTGINFTAPRQLRNYCDIDHPFKDQSELSAEFIYEVIMKYGGAEKFYRHFFITAISPLGYIQNGVNKNYYDDKKLQQAVTPFILRCLHEQASWNVNRDRCICIGGEKNFKFFNGLNGEHGWFKEIIPLPHPRFIMQYRRKTKERFVSAYIAALE